MARAVVDLEDDAQVRELGEQFGEHRRELGVHDDRRRLRVAQQVQQFAGDVAVVDVERSDPRLQRAEHALEVLVAVVEVDREVVLARLVSFELRPLDAAAEALVDEVVGEPPGPLGHLRPREPPIAEHQALVVGPRGRDRLVHVGEAEPNGC